VYRFLGQGAARLFADLFQPTGRRSVPPSILAVVMVLQRRSRIRIASSVIRGLGRQVVPRPRQVGNLAA
jgi:hypothetical protein